MFEKLTLQVPQFSRLEEYSGLWCMDHTAFAATRAMIASMDLQVHVAQNADSPPKPRSAIEKYPGRAGKSVAVIKVMGTLMKQSSSFSGGSSTVQLRKDVRQAANDDDVSAILLAIDSPGGTVAGTKDLADEVKAATKKKPVWAHIDDLGASAAYWIASQCDAIYANQPTAQVGSIGTYAVVYDVSGMAEKAGIKTYLFATGPLKGAGVEGAAITDEQAAEWQSMVNTMQESFDAAVKSGRKLTDKQLADVRSGGCFLGQTAIDKKLIDGIRSYEATFDALAVAGNQKIRESRSTSNGVTLSVENKEKKMNFEQWLSANGFDADALGDKARSKLLAQFEAEQKGTTSIASEAVLESRKAIAAENKRVSDIKSVCKGQHADIEQKAIEDGWDKNQTASAVLDEVRAKRPNPSIITRDHNSDCSREALVAAYILRAGGRLDHPAYQSQKAVAMKVPAFLRAGLNAEQRQKAMEWGHRYSSMSMMDLCREAVRLDGKEVSHDREDLFRAAFSSGGSLTNIFTDSVNAVLLSSYMDSGDTTQGWTSETDVADLKLNERPRVEIGDGLSLLPEGAEADHAKWADVLESYKINRFAKQFVVDEIAVINDSMQVLTETPKKFGEAAGWLRPDIVYSILLQNDSLNATSRALFNTTDANLGSSSALAAATLKVAISAMMSIRENSRNLNLVPTHLVVPTSLYFTANELAASAQLIIAGTAGSVTERGSKNVISDLGLSVVSDGRLENGLVDPTNAESLSGSSSTWYMASNRAHTIEVAYLRGSGRVPQVRSGVLQQGQFGTWFDVRHFVGAKALDWKGLRKTTA